MVVKHVHYLIRLFEIVQLAKSAYCFVYCKLLKQLAWKTFLCTTPRYMFISYPFLALYMYRHPRKKDLVFPVGIDVYRATGFVAN